MDRGRISVGRGMVRGEGENPGEYNGEKQVGGDDEFERNNGESKPVGRMERPV